MSIDDQPSLFGELLGLPRYETASGPIVAVAGIDLGEIGKHYLFRYDYYPSGRYGRKFSGQLMIEAMKKRGFGPGDYPALRKMMRDFPVSREGERIIAMHPLIRSQAHAAVFDGQKWHRQTVSVLPGYVHPRDLFLFYRFTRRPYEQFRKSFFG